jgi:hypothetical protein
MLETDRTASACQTTFPTLEGALKQAQFEYEGVSGTETIQGAGIGNCPVGTHPRTELQDRPPNITTRLTVGCPIGTYRWVDNSGIRSVASSENPLMSRGMASGTPSYSKPICPRVER